MELFKIGILAFGVFVGLCFLAGIYCEMLEIKSKIISLRSDIFDLQQFKPKIDREWEMDRRR